MPVVLVDDNETSRSVTGALLGSWGFEVTPAESGWVALREIQRARKAPREFRLVLLDKTLPEVDGFTTAAQLIEQGVPASAIIMLLPPNTISDDFQRCHEMGIKHHAVKPIGEADLLAEVRSALGMVPEHGETPAAVTRSSDGPRLRILVAEDNLTSQLVARKTLEKMGHTVAMASNGLEASQKVEQSEFDLVLMDGEMPIMDGLEATRQIRKKEAGSGRHIPVIAMTAYAMKEDRNRCLEAGMDGYLSKPAKPEEINAVIHELFLAEGTSPDRAVAPAVDMDDAMKLFGDDRELLSEAADVFLEQDYPEQLANIRDGLKGAARSLGGSALGEVALRLEMAGREGDLTQAETLLAEIERETARFADFFSAGATG